MCVFTLRRLVSVYWLPLLSFTWCGFVPIAFPCAMEWQFVQRCNKSLATADTSPRERDRGQRSELMVLSALLRKWITRNCWLISLIDEQDEWKGGSVNEWMAERVIVPSSGFRSSCLNGCMNEKGVIRAVTVLLEMTCLKICNSVAADIPASMFSAEKKRKILQFFSRRRSYLKQPLTNSKFVELRKPRASVKCLQDPSVLKMEAEGPFENL